MNNADLYAKNNKLPRRDAVQYLDEYVSKMKWKSTNNILDVGCGDGSVTNLLRQYIPNDYKLLGCDISENMINFANAHHCNEQTSFTVLDIVGDVPEGMKGTFDHVFSFYTLHWITNQERAFTNIYNLLNDDGELLTIFIARSPLFDVYRILARNNKWSEWLQDFEKCVSPFQDSKEPEKEVKKILEKIGFVDYDVTCRNSEFAFENLHALRSACSSVHPFKIPQEEYDDFMADYMDILKESQIMSKFNKNYEGTVQFQHRLLVVYARKPAHSGSVPKEERIQPPIIYPNFC